MIAFPPFLDVVVTANELCVGRRSQVTTNIHAITKTLIVCFHCFLFYIKLICATTSVN